jgi:hypothetical protein
MAGTKKLNPDNAIANAGVKSRPARNRKAGAGSVAYAGTKITSSPGIEQRRRLKEAAKLAAIPAAVGGVALYSLIKNTKR